MTQRRRDPWVELFAVPPELAQMLEPRRSSLSSWQPSLDVYETADAFVVVVDVPGMAPSRLDVTLENGVLMIRGERSFAAGGGEDRPGSENYHRIERRFGSFARSVSLPSSAVAPEGVTARTIDGVLTIVVPKAASAQPRKITVTEQTTIDAATPVPAMGEDDS